MYKIVALDNVSRKGLDLFPNNRYAVSSEKEISAGSRFEALIVRSSDLHDLSKWHSPFVLAVARAGAGVNNIPVSELSKRGVVVFNTPGANANSVKELTIASMVLASRKVLPAASKSTDILVHGGDVLKIAEKEKKSFSGSEIAGKTLGVVGLGKIGVLVANAAVSLGMKVVGYDPMLSVESAWNIDDDVVRANSLEELLPSADYVSVHVPYGEKTKDLLGAGAFLLAKRGVIVLNFARNGIVSDEAVGAALESGQCGAYVTDFLSTRLHGLPNVIQLPHLGASTEEAEERCAVMAAEEVRAFLEYGNIRHSVNFPNIELRKTGGTRVLVLHANKPGMLGDLSSILGHRGINISAVANDSRGEYAATLFDVGPAEVSDDAAGELIRHDGVLFSRVIVPLA